MSDSFDYARFVTLTERVARLERQMDFILKHLGLEYVDHPPTAEFPQVAELVSQGKKIEAIKVYREQTGVGLMEAKTYVDGLEQKLLGR